MFILYPLRAVAANRNKIKLGGNNQKLILFSRKPSGPPTNNGNRNYDLRDAGHGMHKISLI